MTIQAPTTSDFSQMATDLQQANQFLSTFQTSAEAALQDLENGNYQAFAQALAASPDLLAIISGNPPANIPPQIFQTITAQFAPLLNQNIIAYTPDPNIGSSVCTTTPGGPPLTYAALAQIIASGQGDTTIVYSNMTNCPASMVWNMLNTGGDYGNKFIPSNQLTPAQEQSLQSTLNNLFYSL